jgi:hypothetical protein
MADLKFKPEDDRFLFIKGNVLLINVKTIDDVIVYFQEMKKYLTIQEIPQLVFEKLGEVKPCNLFRVFGSKEFLGLIGQIQDMNNNMSELDIIEKYKKFEEIIQEL